MTILTERAVAFSKLQQTLIHAASDLFGLYGMPVEHSLGGAADSTGPTVMTVIGYAAHDVRGALLILTSHSVVESLVPEELKSYQVAVEVALRDVLGEFGNMLLGRIKNKLLARNLVPLLSTPTTVFGVALQVPAPTSGMSAWHTFSGTAGELYVRFDATFEPSFSLGEAIESEEPPLAEGEMIAF